MPDFTKAEIATAAPDLTPYTAFLKRLAVGQTVSLPLEPGESPRSVVRSLNAAAAQSAVRLARLPSEPGSVRFRVLPAERRPANLSEEARQARVDKARATREARRQVAAMGLGGLVADPTGHQGDRPLDEAPPVQEVVASGVPASDAPAASGQGGPAEQPGTTQIEAPVEAVEPVETDLAHLGEALGEPVPADLPVREAVPPEPPVREPDAAAPRAGRAPRARRRAGAAGGQ